MCPISESASHHRKTQKKQATTEPVSDKSSSAQSTSSDKHTTNIFTTDNKPHIRQQVLSTAQTTAQRIWTLLDCWVVFSVKLIGTFERTLIRWNLKARQSVFVINLSIIS